MNTPFRVLEFQFPLPLPCALLGLHSLAIVEMMDFVVSIYKYRIYQQSQIFRLKYLALHLALHLALDPPDGVHLVFGGVRKYVYIANITF